MNPVQNPTRNPTDVAHADLNNVLLNGRILINGLPLTANELAVIVRGEQILYGKATQFDKNQEAAKAEKPKKPEKK